MAKKTVTELKSVFETGDTPTQQNFADAFDSFRHQDEKIQLSDVVGLAGDGTTITLDSANKLTIVDNGITEAKIKADSITSAKIKDKSISLSKLASDVPVVGLTVEEKTRVTELAPSGGKVATDYGNYVVADSKTTGTASTDTITDQITGIQRGFKKIIDWVDSIFVKKEAGKGLSQNDYTNGEKLQLQLISNSFPIYYKDPTGRGLVNKNWFIIEVTADSSIRTPRPGKNGDKFLVNISSIASGKKLDILKGSTSTVLKSITAKTAVYGEYDGATWKLIEY